MALEPVPVVAVKDPAKPAGQPGRVAWLPVTSLRVNKKYQRHIPKFAEKRIKAIALAFDWLKFQPIVVASSGDHYAIVDGQHRTAAAIACGLKEVPAWIIDADDVEQAQAFIAINARPSKVSAVQLWHSRLAAKDPEAQALFSMCREAGVVMAKHLGPDERANVCVTYCPDIIHGLSKQYGERVTTQALTVARRVSELQEMGMIRRRIIRMLCHLIDTDQIKATKVEPIAQSLCEIDFDDAFIKADTWRQNNLGTDTEALSRVVLKELARGK